MSFAFSSWYVMIFLPKLSFKRVERKESTKGIEHQDLSACSWLLRSLELHFYLVKNSGRNICWGNIAEHIYISVELFDSFFEKVLCKGSSQYTVLMQESKDTGMKGNCNEVSWLIMFSRPFLLLPALFRICSPCASWTAEFKENSK